MGGGAVERTGGGDHVADCERRLDPPLNRTVWNSGGEHDRFLHEALDNGPFFLLQRVQAPDFQTARIIRRSRRRLHAWFPALPAAIHVQNPNPVMVHELPELINSVAAGLQQGQVSIGNRNRIPRTTPAGHATAGLSNNG